MFNEFIKEQEEEQKLYNSIDKKAVMEKVYNILKEKKHLDKDEVLYSSDKLKINEIEFLALFYKLFEYADEHDLLIHNWDYFEEYYLCFEYKDMNIVCRKVYGQGTAKIFTTDREIIEKYWQEEKAFNFDDIF